MGYCFALFPFNYTYVHLIGDMSDVCANELEQIEGNLIDISLYSYTNYEQYLIYIHKQQYSDVNDFCFSFIIVD